MFDFEAKHGLVQVQPRPHGLGQSRQSLGHTQSRADLASGRLLSHCTTDRQGLKEKDL